MMNCLRLGAERVLLLFLILFPPLLDAQPANLFTTEELEYIAENPVLRVHVEREWPPFNYIEYGEIKGYSNEYIKLLAQKIGFEVEFLEGYNWNEYLEMLRSHKIDLITNIKITPDRREYALFSERSIVTVVDGIAYKTGYDQFSDLDELDNRVLAVVKGYFHEELLRRHYPDIHLLLTNSSLESLVAVSSGRADAAIEASPVLNYYIDKYFLTDISVQPIHDNPVFQDAPQHIGIRGDRPILKSIIDKGIASIDNVELQGIQQRWLNVARSVKSPAESGQLLSREEHEYLQQIGELRYSIDPTWFPMEGEIDGVHQGISADFIRDFEQMLGIDLTYVPSTSWSESLMHLSQGDIDFLPLVEATEERQRSFRLSRAYINEPLVLATRDGSSYVENLNGISARKVGVVEGYSIFSRIQADYPNLEVVTVKDVSDGLLAVEHGDLFGIIDGQTVISYQIQHYHPGLRINTRLDEDVALGIAVGLNDEMLATIFEKAIDSIGPSRRQEIFNRWSPIVVEHSGNYSEIWKIVFFSFTLLILILLFFVYRQVLLQKYNRELELLSTTDSLTGLPNRRLLLDRINHAQKIAKRNHEFSAILFLDLNGFKQVNDTHGHHVGDELLKSVSRRLTEHVREIDTVARLGGDEFVILLESLADSQQRAESYAIEISEKIHQAFAGKFMIIGYEIEVSSSIGICLFSGDECTPEQLISNADTSMYRNKKPEDR